MASKTFCDCGCDEEIGVGEPRIVFSLNDVSGGAPKEDTPQAGVIVKDPEHAARFFTEQLQEKP